MNPPGKASVASSKEVSRWPWVPLLAAFLAMVAAGLLISDVRRMGEETRREDLGFLLAASRTFSIISLGMGVGLKARRLLLVAIPSTSSMLIHLHVKVRTVYSIYRPLDLSKRNSH